MNAPDSDQMLVWPFFVPGPLEARSAASVFRALLAASGVNADWSPPEPLGPTALRARGRTIGRLAASGLAWIPSAKGTAGYFYVVSAAEATYRKNAVTYVEILRSFHITGATASTPSTASGAPPSVHWTRWNDPRENAFSLEVPSGWRTQGGLFRFASVDVRGAWETVSPDGAIRISGGDAELPTFTEPTPMLAMSGFREGGWYSPGYGVRMLVRRYQPGAMFSREYAATRAARGCSDLRITSHRERPDAVTALNQVYAQYGGSGVSVQLTAGETAFTCRAQQLMRGYYFAATQRVQAPGMPGGIWNAEYLFGYLAAEASDEQAQSVLEHLLKSIAINPQWAAMQQGVAAQTSQIVSRTHAEISNLISSTYANRQAVMDELSRRRSNATLGVVDVIDPVTGREIKVENSANYYWIDQRGTIVGTQTDTRPNLDFRQLIQLP